MTAAMANPQDRLRAQQRAHEPSMEEILASIRRIIADDRAPAAAAAVPAPAPAAPEAVAAAPAPAPVAPQAPSLAAPAPESAIDLTPDLAHDLAAAAAEPAPPPPAPAIAPRPAAVAASAPVVTAPVLAAPVVAAPLVAASAPDPEPEPGPDLWSAPVATAPAAETDVAPDPEACAEPERETAVEARSAQPVAPGSGTDFAPEPSPRRPARAAPLVSPQTDQNVQAAFSRLTSTMMAQNSRTLEDLVGDMLRPMLKTWLDDNLPSIVERLVRAEIERVARGGR